MERRDGSRPSSFWRRARLALLGLVLARGVVLLCVVPPFEAWDEYQHLAYVDHLAAGGERPVLGRSVVPEPWLRSVVAFPQSHAALGDGLSQRGAVDYDTFWSDHDPLAGLPPPAFRPGAQRFYQAQHGPLAYRLAAPIFSALGGRDNPRAAVAALRLINLGLTVLSVAVVLAILRRLVPSEATAFLLALPLAAHPLFLLNGTRVANDALGLLLATVSVGLGLGLARSGGRSCRESLALALLLGLALGLAAQAKATNLALLPFAFLAWCLHGRAQRTGTAIAAGPLIALAFLAVEAPDLSFNLAHYGMPTVMQESLRTREQGRTLADLARVAGSFRWGTELARLWTRELYFKGGWSFLRTIPAATWSYQLLVRLGLFGWAFGMVGLLVRRARRRPDAENDALRGVDGSLVVLLVSVVLGYSAALGYHMAQSKLAWGVPTTCPWYAAPALPWFLTLVGLGGLAWLPSRAQGTLAWSLAATGLAGEIVGLWGMMIPTYAGLDAPWRLALQRLAWLQPAPLGTPTLMLALAMEAGLLAWLILLSRDGIRPDQSWDGNRSERALGRPLGRTKLRSSTPAGTPGV